MSIKMDVYHHRTLRLPPDRPSGGRAEPGRQPEPATHYLRLTYGGVFCLIETPIDPPSEPTWPVRPGEATRGS